MATTVPGGRYRRPDGSVVDANGKVLEKATKAGRREAEKAQAPAFTVPVETPPSGDAAQGGQAPPSDPVEAGQSTGDAAGQQVKEEAGKSSGSRKGRKSRSKRK